MAPLTEKERDTHHEETTNSIFNSDSGSRFVCAL